MPRLRTGLSLLLILLLLFVGGTVLVLRSLSPASPDGIEADAGLDTSRGAESGSNGRPMDGEDGTVDEDGTREPRRDRTRTRRQPRPGRDAAGEDASDDGEGEHTLRKRDPDENDKPDDNASAGGSSPSADAPTPMRRLRGTVKDLMTGDGIDGVRVLLSGYDADSRSLGWHGATTDSRGRFEFQVPANWGDEGARFEVRAFRRGYHLGVVPVVAAEQDDEADEPEEIEVQLEPMDVVPVPCRIVGHARTKDGKPLSGLVLIGGRREGLDGLWQWAVADRAGRFVLEGVPPGAWRLNLEESPSAVETTVPESGETVVQLVARDPAWPVPMTREEYDLRHRKLRKPGGYVLTDDGTVADERTQGLRRILAVQRLEVRWQALAPRRVVEVTGLPRDSGPLWLRAGARSGPNTYWRVAVQDDRASFPGLTIEGWTLILERPDGAIGEMRIDVTEGDSPMQVRFEIR